MATWTNITNAALEPGKPIRSVDGLALRDNPIAIAEGASGAPRIVNDAVTNGTLGSEKFQTGTAERDWVLGRTSGASTGALGTYAFLARISGGNALAGTVIAGSDLEYSDSGGQSSGTPSGSWRLMGNVNPGAGIGNTASLFLRIA